MTDATAKFVIAATRAGEQAFRSFEADLNKIGDRAKLAAAAATAAFVLLEKQAFSSIDALAKQADVLSIATDKLAGLQLGASLAGIENEQLTKALERQRKTIYDASQGLTTATRALDQLGLKTEDLLKLDTYEQMLKISDALSQVENATIRGGLAADIYGSKNTKLLALFNEGSDAIRAYVAEAEELGIAVNRVDAAKIEQANDAVERATRVFQGLANIVAVQLAPYITAAADAFTETAGNAERSGRVVRSTLDQIASGVGFVLDAYYGWQLLIPQLRASTLDFAAFYVETWTRIVKATEAARDAFANVYVSGLEIAEKLDPLGLGNLVGRDFAKGVAESVIGNDSLSRALTEISESFRATADDSERTVGQLIAAGKPSEALAAAMERARTAAQQAAEATARAASVRIEVAGGEAPDVETEAEKRAREAAEKAEQRLREQAQREFEVVREGTLTREEAELEAIRRRFEILQNAHERGLVGEQQYQDIAARIYAQGQERLNKIEQDGLNAREKFQRLSLQKKASTFLSDLTAVTAGVAQHNKKMFQLNKLLAYANAVVSTAEGIAKAWSYGPILGPIYAAVVAAAGAAQIQAIKATTFEGGGSGTTPTSAGGTPTLGGQPIPQAAPTPERDSARGKIEVNVYASNIIGAGGREELGEFLSDVLRDHVDRTDDVVINVDSRNGRILATGG